MNGTVVDDLLFPVRLELGERLGDLSDNLATDAMVNGVSRDISAVLAETGVAGYPLVEVAPADTTRVCRIRVRDVLVPYPPSMLRRVWTRVTGEEPFHPTLREFGGSPRAWAQRIRDWVDESGSERARRLDQLGLVLQELTRDVLRARPGVLIGRAHAAQILGDGSDDHDRLEFAETVIRRVLDLVGTGGSCDVAGAALRLALDQGRSVDDTVELIFRRFRSGSMEVHIHRSYLSALVPGASRQRPTSILSPAVGEVLPEHFESLATVVSTAFGVTLPGVFLVPSKAIPEASLAVKINGSLGPVVAGLRPGEILVDELPRRMEARGMAGRPAENPLLGAEATIVEAQHATAVDDAGLTWRSAEEYLVLAVYAEVARLADRLVSVADVEYRLAKLKPTNPELVETVTGNFTLAQLTLLLRTLLREGLSISNLEPSLEQLLLALVTPTDDRFAPSGRSAAERSVAAVRRGLADAISAQLSGGRNVLVVHRADSDFERSASEVCADGQTDPATERAREELLDQVWASIHEIGRLHVRPAVMSSERHRPAVRHLLSEELPELPVVTPTDVSPDVAVHVWNREEGRMATREAVTKARVGSILGEFLGARFFEDSDGDFAFKHGREDLFVRVNSLHESSTVVTVFSITNEGVPPSPAVFKWVCDQNGTLLFGTIRAVEEERGVRILCMCSLLGDFLDAEELVIAIMAVGALSNDIAGKVHEQFGGELFAGAAVSAAPSDGELKPPGQGPSDA